MTIEKIAVSDAVILAAKRSAEKWMNKNTGSSYKPKSFEERDAISKLWSRKFKQRDFFRNLSKAVMKDKSLKSKLVTLLKARFV